MTLFKVLDQKGKKYLETPSGETVPISGKQLDKDAVMVPIYRDANANYWFINKHGQPTTIPPSKVQWAINDISEQRYAKEHTYPIGTTTAPGAYPQTGYPAPVQQTTIIEQPGSSGTGSSALGTGVAAAGGAMVGGMVGGLIGDSMYGGSHYYGVPYGSPIYHDGNRSYYNSSGNKAYINNEHTDPVVKQFNAQGDWDHRNQWNPSNTTTHPNTTPTGGEKMGYQNHPNYGGEHPQGGFGHEGGLREGWGGFRGRRR